MCTPAQQGSQRINNNDCAASIRRWLVLEQWMTPELWQGVSGSPVGEQRLMLAAAQQGMTDTVRMWNHSYLSHL